MNETVIRRLAQAIGYPEEVPRDAAAYSFAVDDGRVEAAESGGRLVLSCEIASADDVDLAQFAGYAAGRVLREDAVLAYDPAGDRLILWQDLPAASGADLLRRLFEVFTASCDWWRSRVDGAAVARVIPEMMIRP